MSVAAAVTLGVTISLAVAGYFATYLVNLRLQRRKDRLERVNQQLRDLYGPLYALLRAADVAWLAFRSRFRPAAETFWDPDCPPSEEDVAAWRLWVSTVFAPLNQRMVDAVTAHADLLREEEMPPCLIALCAHVSGYAPVMATWDSGTIDVDWRRNVSVIGFPREALAEYVDRSFVALKREQAVLLRAVGTHSDGNDRGGLQDAEPAAPAPEGARGSRSTPSVASSEPEATIGALLERLLVDRALRDRFGQDPAAVASEFGLPDELVRHAASSPSATAPFDTRETRSSLPGTFMAAGVENVGQEERSRRKADEPPRTP